MTSSAASSRAGRPARAGRGTTPEVQGVTTAAAGRSADREARMKVYLVQMLLRTACFVAALFTHGWWQLGFILGAVVLPYVAVVMANATASRSDGFELPPGQFGSPELGGTTNPQDKDR